MPRRPYNDRDEDVNLLRMALMEQAANTQPGRVPSGIAHNAYLGSIPRTFEQEREGDILGEADRRYYQNREDERARASKVDDLEAAATMRNFETRKGVKEDAGTLAGSPSPDGMRTIRRFTQNATPTDADAAASAREKAMRDPRVLVEEARAKGDIDAINAKADAAMPVDTSEADATREEIIRLATEIKNHGALNANVGPLDDVLPTVWGDSRDFQSKATRLRDLLALEARSKLKGQGAVSDFEGKMLANSQTSLRTNTDEGSFKSELDRIIEDQKRKATAGVKWFNPKTQKVETR